MKRYLLFSTVGPFLGGLLLLMAETITSGYWYRASPPDISLFMLIFLATLLYNYLFGIPMAFTLIITLLPKSKRRFAMVASLMRLRSARIVSALSK
jgi:hypothetical protein